MIWFNQIHKKGNKKWRMSQNRLEWLVGFRKNIERILDVLSNMKKTIENSLSFCEIQ